jgi:signal transduction histidine kinase
MTSVGKPRLFKIRHSLRGRAALGIALPVFIILLVLSLFHYVRERNLMAEQVRLTATQIGEVTLGSLRHVMLEKDETHLGQILEDVGQMENIQRLMIIGLDGQIAADSLNIDSQLRFDTDDMGCQECHQVSPEERERATILESQPTTLRISTPIDNDPVCQVCHVATTHIGMQLIDVSLVDTQANAINDLTIDLSISFGITILITLGVYQLMQRLIVQRVEQLHEPLGALSAGDFSVRLPSPARSRDELDTLTRNVNRMADDLERYVHELEQLHNSRYQAMLEERERIAREIHDGVAQLMGYVLTKSTAIRLLLEDDKQDTALEQLDQLSLASKEAMLEIRASILGLRASHMNSEGIHNTLSNFLKKYKELTGIEIESELPRNDKDVHLSPENELHVLRITQEALMNVHKHSGAKQALVTLRRVNGQAELRIRDYGDGFDTPGKSSNSPLSFGLNNMRERAVAMEATLEIHTRPHLGTEIVVRIPLETE